MKKIAYVINNVGFFVSHRLPLALEAINKGYDVYLITGLPGSKVIEEKAKETISKLEIQHIEIPFTSRGMNPFVEIKALFMLIRKIRLINPDIIHAASPKGIFFAAISGISSSAKRVILSVSGMGFLFTSSHRIIIRLIAALFKYVMIFAINIRATTIIVQNKDDLSFWSNLVFSSKVKITLVPGSGINLDDYDGMTYRDDSKTILFPSRILIDKGVYEFVEAAKLVKLNYPDWRFILVGASDYDNPSAVDEMIIDKWVADGIVESLGHQDDMTDVYRNTSIVCLPSYREGMPKVLLEAAAAGIPVITTDVIGCRESIIPNVTGLLVPSHDAKQLASAIEKLINNLKMRKQMGAEGSKFAKERFSIEKILSSVFKLYDE